MRFSDLHGYQLYAIGIVLLKKRCALFLGLGLGKTIVALTVAAIELAIGRSKRVLVIAPLRVANTVWHVEAAQWWHTKGLSFSIATGSAQERMDALEADADIYVINVDNVQWLAENYTRRYWKWDFVIIDESSRFKNPSSKRVKTLRPALVDKILKIKGKPKNVLSPVKHLMLLTATPATNGLEGLWSQASLIDNGKSLGKSFDAYQKTYFYREVKGNSRHAKLIPFDDAKKRIYSRMSKISFAMRSDDYIKLPPITYNNITVHMSEVQLKMYKELEREFLLELDDEMEFLTGDGEEITATNEGALSNKLLQFANGAVYTGETPDKVVKDRDYAVIHDTKLDALDELITNAEGNESLLVAYYYKSDLARILDRFPKVEVLGKKGDEVAPFNAGKIPVLLAHPDSAGMGLNLQRGSSTVVFFSLLWNLESYQQFIGRVYRQGQKHGVTVNHIVCAKTIEARVISALRSKAKTQQDFIDAIRIDPTDVD